MTELSFEQKAQRYDEALALARDYYKANLKLNKTDENLILEDILPELKESKDEEIREALISLLKSDFESDTTVFGISIDEIIVWLKKQKEKPVWTDNDRTMVFTLLRDVDQMTYISKEGKDERIEWLNSLDDRFKKV